jgi:hypothetical protein
MPGRLPRPNRLLCGDVELLDIVVEAVHDFVTEYLEPQGVADNTVRAYTADIAGIARLVAARAAGRRGG